MTKSEALEFLELPETATDSEIKIRVEDKLAYFERLSEKAPSDFLKRLHARNAAKVSEIQLLSKKWPSYVAPVEEVAVTPEIAVTSSAAVTPEIAVTPEPVITVESAVSAAAAAAISEAVTTPETVATSESVVTPEAAVTPLAVVTPEEELVRENDQIILTPEPVGVVEPALTPVVQPEVVVKPEAIAEAKVVVEETAKPEAVVVKSEPVVVKSEPVATTGMESSPETMTGPEPLAWLIRHTENQSAKTFPLYPGKNYLGRKPRPDLIPFIEVEEDPYISKVHAVLFADKASVYISDPSGDEGKPSKNGIFLNADENRLKETTRLKEKDTVQIGVTKLILRYNNQTIGKIVEEVREQDYMHTVVIDIA